MNLKKLKKASAALAAVGCLLLPASSFAADSFQKIYHVPYATDQLGKDQAWSNNFTTNDGDMVLQVRRLLASTSDKRFHLIATLGKNRVFDAYYPEVTGGYSLLVFKDTSNGNMFYAFESQDRAYLMGYDRGAKKMVVYADSQSFYNNFKGVPQFVATAEGDLIMAIESVYLDGRAQERHRYQFTWDEEKNWFSYEDLGTGWPSIAQEEP